MLSALARCSIAIGKESNMATSKSDRVFSIFQAPKRLRVEAGVSATRITATDPFDGPTDEILKIDSLKTKTLKRSVVAKASNAFDLHPLPGFEPPPHPRVEQRTTEEKDDESRLHEGEVSGQEKVSEFNEEQKMRMELNKAIARARRNLLLCKEHITETRRQGKTFPDFQDLLVEKSWRDVLQDEFSKQYMSKLNTFVLQEAAGKLPVYPPPALIFNAFNTCPFDKVKVVIIGQDPYHGPGQAMGLSFSVPQGMKVPSSLMNIFKEIFDDVGSKIPSHGNLEKWAHQGVLLLNAVLTVREHHANSHAKKGWEPFTDAAIRAVSQQKKGIIFLLWGNSAHEKTRLINVKEHHILKAAHPSGLSAHKGFFNCRHFSKTNQILGKAGELPIDWKV